MRDQHDGLVERLASEPRFERAGLPVLAFEALKEGVENGQLLYRAEAEQLGGLEATAPLAGEHAGLFYAVRGKVRADARGLIAPFIGQIPLCAAIAEDEGHRITRARRDGMAQQRHVSRRTQRAPERRAFGGRRSRRAAEKDGGGQGHGRSP
jgi:hypothetical protein